MTVIEADGLARRFGRCEAVGSLTLRVKAGEALCLLGPSGAGKSAALRMLAGRLRPEGGAARIGGEEARRGAAGYLPQSLPRSLRGTAGQLLRRAAQRAADPDAAQRRAAALAQSLSIDESAQFAHMAPCARKLLAAAAALAPDLPAYLLDDPFTGLAPQAIDALAAVLAAEKARGKAMVLASRWFETAALCCEHAVLLRAGHAGSQQRVEALRAAGRQVVWFTFASERAAVLFAGGLAGAVRTGARVRCESKGAPDALLKRAALYPVAGVYVANESLEKRFPAFYGE